MRSKVKNIVQKNKTKKKFKKKKEKKEVDINHNEFKNIIIWNSSLCRNQEFCSSRRLEFKFLSLVVAIQFYLFLYFIFVGSS